MSDSSGTKPSDLKTEQMVNFMVGGEEFAIEISHVREVINCPDITKLPRTPVFVQGVIDLRGEIIPIIDMRVKLGLQTQEKTPYAAVIIVETDGKYVGAVVDRICQVIRINQDQITPPVRLVAGLSGEYVRGMGKLGDRLIVILDVGKILTPKEITQLDTLEEASSGAGARQRLP